MDRDELFNLCAYIAASAEGLKDEPKDYGPLRLLEVLRRLARLTAAEYEDAFLKKIAKEVREGQRLVMRDKAAFYCFLQQLVVQFAKESKRRGIKTKEST